MDNANINKLISLTFDERPEVRKEVAKQLGTIDNPAASFALVELGFDKDPSVREVAQLYLDKRKQTEPELMSFATIFSAGAKKDETPAEATDSKAKMMRPIEQIFEKSLGKEKAEAVKTKMMPSIERMYQHASQHHGSKKKTDEDGRKAMQEFLTSYLEAISDLDRVGDGKAQVETPAAPPEPSAAVPEVKAEPKLTDTLEIGELGRQTNLEVVSSEVHQLDTLETEEQKETEGIEKLPDTYFKKAYEIMMLANGDEDTMRNQMESMINDAKREIGLAFRLAKKRFKENKITNITKIHDGMRNINTETLVVKSAENMQYQKTKAHTAMLTRVLVNDETGNEGVLYLFDNRGTALKPDMRIRIVKGLAKTFDFSKETALTLGKKGNVYIVL